jgi:hypothetical protein
VGSGFADTNGSVMDLTNQEGFISPFVSVNVAAGQSVYVSANTAFESITDISERVDSWVAYEPTGGTLTNVSTKAQLLDLPGRSLASESLSAVISGLAPGTYQVGLGGFAEGNQINFPRVYQATTSALVLQG